MALKNADNKQEVAITNLQVTYIYLVKDLLQCFNLKRFSYFKIIITL